MFYAEGADVSVATAERWEKPRRVWARIGSVKTANCVPSWKRRISTSPSTWEPTGEINAGNLHAEPLTPWKILVPKLGQREKSGEYYITGPCGHGRGRRHRSCGGPVLTAATRTCSDQHIPPNWRHPRNWRPACHRGGTAGCRRGHARPETMVRMGPVCNRGAGRGTVSAPANCTAIRNIASDVIIESALRDPGQPTWKAVRLCIPSRIWTMPRSARTVLVGP